MFYKATTFNQDISKWNVASVTSFSISGYGMFNGASAFNQNIATWNVASVTDMWGMFYGATAFNANIGSWNTARVTNMQAMIAETAFNGNIGSWNVASVTHMQNMFYKATTFNQDISKWNVASVTSFSISGYGMFNGASAFDQNIASWNVLCGTTLTSTFDSAGALSSCNKGAIYRHWGATLRAAYPGFSSMCGASCSLTCLIDANIGTAATAWLTSPGTATTIYGPIADWDTSAVTSMASLFEAKPTFNGDISKWNVASVSILHKVRLDSACSAFSKLCIFV
jgi:surface protein